MEPKVKFVCLIPFILLLMEISPNEGLRVVRLVRIRVRPTRRPPTTPPTTPQPTTPPRVSNSVIPSERCRLIVNECPFKGFSKLIKGPLCIRLNEEQKLDRLKDAGGYNPRYVAINRREAQNFTSLVQDTQPLPTRTPGNYSQSFNNQSALSNILHQRQRRQLRRPDDDDDDDNDEEEEEEEEDGGRRRGNVLPAAGQTTIQQCFDGGSLLGGGQFRRLCTECFAITQLRAGAFPRFINEVICGDSDFCVPNIGVCQQKVITFNFIRFTGNFEKDDDLSDFFGFDVYLEETETFERDIRACCECRSFSFIGK